MMMLLHDNIGWLLQCIHIGRSSSSSSSSTIRRMMTTTAAVKVIRRGRWWMIDRLFRCQWLLCCLHSDMLFPITLTCCRLLLRWRLICRVIRCGTQIRRERPIRMRRLWWMMRMLLLIFARREEFRLKHVARLSSTLERCVYRYFFIPFQR